MSETSRATRARRRLDLGAAAHGEETKRKRRVVENPYRKAPKSTTANAAGLVVGEAAAASTESPPRRPSRSSSRPRGRREEGGSLPPARKLVTPASTNAKGKKRMSREFNSEDDDVDGLCYHSDGGSRSKNSAKKKKQYEPGHIHSTLAYYHRGELPSDQGTLGAYRFIRNNFLVPRDIEADPKFGPHSGSSFEERVVRAYNLGQLEPKDAGMTGEQLLVCSYCDEEGHKRYACSELI